MAAAAAADPVVAPPPPQWPAIPELLEGQTLPPRRPVVLGRRRPRPLGQAEQVMLMGQAAAAAVLVRHPAMYQMAALAGPDRSGIQVMDRALAAAAAVVVKRATHHQVEVQAVLAVVMAPAAVEVVGTL